LLGAPGHRPDGLPHVDVRVGDAEHARDVRVQPRLLAQRLRRIDLLAVDAGVATALDELVGVGGVVPWRRDEEAADVLDAVGGDLLQDAVLADALLGRVRVLDRVPTPGVQQPVEAAAGAFGEVEAVDEHDVIAAQGGIPGHAGAGGATADHQYVGV